MNMYGMREESWMKKIFGTALLGGATAIALIVGSTAATGVSLGARYCASGYDAYTAAASTASPGIAWTVIHQQTSGGVTRMAGLPTYSNAVRKWSAGWQSFSSSSVSDYTQSRYTGCF